MDTDRNRGIRALLAGNAGEAVRALTSALWGGPDDLVIRFDLAVACRLTGDIDGALGHARIALQLADVSHTHTLYGLHLWLAQRLDDAEDAIAIAVDRDPADRLAAMYLGLIHRDRGRPDAAIASLECAVAPGVGALPTMIAARVRGQLFDLRGAQGRNAPPLPHPRVALCSVAVVTEILLADGSRRVVVPGTPPGRAVVPGPARIRRAAQVAAWIDSAHRVVVLTGAGASAASGLATRKDLWQRFDRDTAVSAIGVARDPAGLWSVVRQLLGIGDHPPNAAHHVLARIPHLEGIITQNVDGLHQRAALDPDVPVIELHGTLARMRCGSCGIAAPHPAAHYVGDHDRPPPCLRCGEALRPDVVLFGEQVPPGPLDAAVRAARRCDLLLVVGCAMDVSPAAELPRIAAAHGARIVEIKRTASRISNALGTDLLLGAAEEVLPAVHAHLAEATPLPLPTAIHHRPAPVRGIAVRLPALGEGIDDAELIDFGVGVGEMVVAGQALAEVGTDKVCIEIPAPFAGIVRRLAEPPDDRVAVDGVLAEIAPAPVSTPFVVHLGATDDPLLVDLGTHGGATWSRLGDLVRAPWIPPPAPTAAWRAQIVRAVARHAAAIGCPLVAWFPDDPAEVVHRLSTPDSDDPATHAWIRGLARTQSRRRHIAPTALVHRCLRPRWVDAGLPDPVIIALQRGVAADLDWIAATGLAPADPDPMSGIVEIWAAGGWPVRLPGGVVGICRPSPGGWPTIETRESDLLGLVPT